MGKTRAELLRDLDVGELRYWMAFFDLEPPDGQQEAMFGALMAGMYNSSGNTKKTYKATDFIPDRQRMFESADVKRKRVADKVRAIFGKPKK